MKRKLIVPLLLLSLCLISVCVWYYFNEYLSQEKYPIGVWKSTKDPVLLGDAGSDIYIFTPNFTGIYRSDACNTDFEWSVNENKLMITYCGGYLTNERTYQYELKGRGENKKLIITYPKDYESEEFKWVDYSPLSESVKTMSCWEVTNNEEGYALAFRLADSEGYTVFPEAIVDIWILDSENNQLYSHSANITHEDYTGFVFDYPDYYRTAEVNIPDHMLNDEDAYGILFTVKGDGFASAETYISLQSDW